MIDKPDAALAEYCDTIEQNIGAFVDELRAIDLVDLVSFVRLESFATIEDLVNSSTELLFKPDMLVFSWAAAVDLQWDALPVVTLGLEFRHPTVSVFFNLTIRSADEQVEVLGLSFEEPPRAPHQALARAFMDAHLVRRSSPPRPAVAVAARRLKRGLPWS